MKTYKHTQVGYVILYVTLVLALFFIWLNSIIPLEEGGMFSAVFMVVIILILLSFSTLQTVVNGKYLRIKFGYGIFKKKFLLEEITSSKAVKNRWYYGWGIRMWFWPYMWIFNVSGFDAVEIKMKSGKIFRIGTDVPQELETEINKHVNK